MEHVHPSLPAGDSEVLFDQATRTSGRNGISRGIYGSFVSQYLRHYPLNRLCCGLPPDLTAGNKAKPDHRRTEPTWGLIGLSYSKRSSNKLHKPEQLLGRLGAPGYSPRPRKRRW